MMVELLKYPDGILSGIQIAAAIDSGIVCLNSPLLPGQIQPASLDLRLGKRAWRLRASFLPGQGMTVADKIDNMAMHEIDLEKGAVLERGCVYIAELEENLNLPQGMMAFANPKSSTGRLDVFTRMIANEANEFEVAPDGYKGAIYAEISPRTFSILVRRGSRLSQLRLRKGETQVSDADMQRLQKDVKLVYGGGLNGSDIRSGVPLSVDLSGNIDKRIKGLVGWRARKNAGLIDIDKPKHYLAEAFWEKITKADLSDGGLVLNPDEFYILASKECVMVPPDYAAEMSAYDTRVGEFRAHYAGFFDPGFGMAALGAGNTRAVLEVRSHDVPFLVEEGQTVCRLAYEPLSQPPKDLYGAEGSGSNYQAQGLQLAKHFLPPKGDL